MTDEERALAAFERLGLTSYEARVLVALYRLGTGTARDVARTTDVPRSQVYSVAEDLEERGLLEVDRSTPIRYRPVAVTEARRVLRERLEREHERAFGHVEAVEQEAAEGESREAIWTLRGRDRIAARVVDLVADATDRVVVGTSRPEHVTDELAGALADLAAGGVSVVCLSEEPAIRERLGAIEGVSAVAPPSPHVGGDRFGWLVVVDDDTILLSVREDGETAIWSADSQFASVLIRLIEETPIGLDGA